MLKILFFFIFSIISFNSYALKYTQHKLANGLEAFLIEDHRQPIALHMLWYDIGSADEEPGKSGLAHLLEHLMFKGTDNIPPQEFSKIIARLGGVDNASTSFDYTNYYQLISIENLDKAMSMEADRMRNLKLSEQDFNTERNVVIQERQQRIDNAPLGRFYEKVMNALYSTLPYKIITTGTLDDLKNLEKQDAIKWYKDYYAPNNAKLIIIGDLNPELFKKLVEKNYGNIKPSEIKKDKWATEPLYQQAKSLIVKDRQIKSATYYKIFRVPSLFSPLANNSFEKNDIYALTILANILAGSETSYLYRKLVLEQQIINAIDIDYSPVSKAETTFDIYIQAKDDITTKATEDALNQALNSFIKEFNNKDLLENTKTQIKASQIYAKDDAIAFARSLGKFLSSGGDINDYQDFYQQIDSVSIKDLKQVARKYLLSQQQLNAWLLPE